MAVRRSLVRFWRRLRRPTLTRLVVASLVFHLVLGAGLLAWLGRQPLHMPPSLQAPLVVELPPAEPGQPLVRPEAPPAQRSTPRAPAPPRSAPAPQAPPPPPPVAAKPPETPPQPTPAQPPPPTPVAPPEAPTPPVVARAPEPPEPTPEPAPVPPAAPAAPAPSPPAPPAPVVAARPPESAAPARPSTPAPPSDFSESPLAGLKFSLLGPRLNVPPADVDTPPPSGSGGTRQEGSGAGSFGYERDGQAGVPLNTTDPRYAEYFAELKRRIEANWVYPQEAVRRGQSGQGLVGFVLRKNGSVREVDIVQSSGIEVLDRYLVNAINLASPMPPIPDRIGQNTLPVVFAFTYTLQQGVRVFGFR